MGLDAPLAARCVSALAALLEREEHLFLRRPPTWPTAKAALKASQHFTDLTRLHVALQPSEARRLLLCALPLHDAVNHWLSVQGDAASELTLSQRHTWLRSRLELLTDLAATCHAQQARKEALAYLYKALDCHYGLLELALLDTTPNHALLLARIEIARAHLHLGAVSTELQLLDAGAFHARTAASVAFEVLLAAAQAPVVARRQRDEWAQLLGRALYDFSVHQEKQHEVELSRFDLILNDTQTADALQACRKAYEVTVASVGKQHPRADVLWKRLDTLVHVTSATKTNKSERGSVDADPWRTPSAWKSLLQSFGYVGGCDVPEKPAIPTKPPAAKKIAPTPRVPKTPTKPNIVDLTGCPTPRLLALSPVLHKDIVVVDPSPTPNARRPQSATAWARSTASTSALATPPKRPRPQTASSGRCPTPRIFSPVRSNPATTLGHKTRLELAIADANGTKTVVALTILDTLEAPLPENATA
ncbi:hypothetical protein SDRG_03432 [Saprolegnia diclina VS20]|uniref:Uncharacterized protein n=1 Tax=Saprolegnia diclina (strain VS20) TaxID=1156394 RepID=T0S963_SAPDV|nr:hypothetical protein SDRG_03432 [Saprolegnia diclina VS20]EQC39227.1 hypothetical protein SDRG_03432 [Saprolegnia diclina VS20]|eukprot:XP_008607288.1 hypothetical protein SDRG_03432 [Saprolegnia diclina VS20]